MPGAIDAAIGQRRRYGLATMHQDGKGQRTKSNWTSGQSARSRRDAAKSAIFTARCCQWRQGDPLQDGAASCAHCHIVDPEGCFLRLKGGKPEVWLVAVRIIGTCGLCVRRIGAGRVGRLGQRGIADDQPSIGDADQFTRAVQYQFGPVRAAGIQRLGAIFDPQDIWRRSRARIRRLGPAGRPSSRLLRPRRQVADLWRARTGPD